MFPERLSIQFIARSWQETPFHEISDGGKLSRASILNTLSGDLQGEGTLEYLMSYPANAEGSVSFIGLERITGNLGELTGSFVIKHEGVYSPTEGVKGTIYVMDESGTGAFSGLTGKGSIIAKPGEHGGEYLLELRK